jgi:two-component system, LytTR family, response regulator
MSNLPKIDRIAWPTKTGYDFTDRNEVAYCKADGSYTMVYLTDGREILISYKLKSAEMVLGGFPFFRVHESHLVNLNLAKAFLRSEGKLTLAFPNCTIPVAKGRRRELIELFSTLKKPLVEPNSPPAK